MQKSQLVSLINEIRHHYAGEIDIVGSQSSYAVSMTPHDIVNNSMEGDVLIADEYVGNLLKEACGRYSEYHARTKIHLDVLTTRAVILPNGWKSRRLPMMDLDRAPMPGVFAADIHDVSCAKLIAGREKDFVFLTEFLRSLDIKLSVLAERIRLVEDHYRFKVIPERTVKWGRFIEERKLRKEATEVLALGKVLAEETCG